MQAPIAEAPALLGDRPHALTQGGIIRPVVWYLTVMQQ